MNYNKDPNPTEEYILVDISQFASGDPRAAVPNAKRCHLNKKEVEELNYARALNGDPHRLVKVDWL